MYVIFFLISIVSTIIGAICGIGGGIIIKPALDSFALLSVPVISFLSGCTVLAMTGYTVIRSKIAGDSVVDMHRSTAIAVGAAVGGFLGQAVFDYLCVSLLAEAQVGAVQSALLLTMLVVSLIYTLNKEKIHSINLENTILCLLCGMFLGMLSSFIGIGGGPINMVFLYYFFSMRSKVAVQNSLYIILFAQLASLITALVSGTVPIFDYWILILMISGGIMGAACGRKINKHLDDALVNRLFIILMIIIILVNGFNIFRFMMN